MYRWLFNRSWEKRRAAARIEPRREAAFTVRKGKRYRATVLLSWVESFAGNEVIAEKLSEAGFKEVKVSGNGSRRRAEALWDGPDTTAEIDPHLSEITEVA